MKLIGKPQKMVYISVILTFIQQKGYLKWDAVEIVKAAALPAAAEIRNYQNG